MSEPAIRAAGLSKRFRIGRRPRYKSLRESLQNTIRTPFRRGGRAAETIWALRDVSFDIAAGEVVGVIGRNGAGKSTLLKVLARITEPTEGRVELRGRVGSLLEVGTGFHLELTGRENIFLAGAILGMKRAEIVRRFDEIVAFAEVERFLDTPVKHYSTGMYLRLAFAVAAHLEPEILLVDEVLAVGDAAFQKKCLGKMGDVARGGRTVVFVSHNMAAVTSLCGSTIWLDGGQLHERGATDAVVSGYLSSSGSSSAAEWMQPRRQPTERNACALRVAVTDREGRVVDAVTSDAPLWVEIDYLLTSCVEGVRAGYRLLTPEGVVVFTSTDTDPAGWGEKRGPGRYRSRCRLPGNLLNGGRYFVTVACDVPMREILFFEEAVVSFTVHLTAGVGGAVPDGRRGVVRPQLEWTVGRLENEVLEPGAQVTRGGIGDAKHH